MLLVLTTTSVPFWPIAGAPMLTLGASTDQRSVRSALNDHALPLLNAPLLKNTRPPLSIANRGVRKSAGIADELFTTAPVAGLSRWMMFPGAIMYTDPSGPTPNSELVVQP